jgi:dTDP-4-dehydrorhamnose reductase
VKLLVTGGEGQLGTELISQAPAHGITVLAPTLAEMDLTRPEQIAVFCDGFQPRAVVNAAAYTQVDRAESESGLAFAVNAEAPAFLAQRCAAQSIPLIHISTDYVFDGLKGTPYVEEDPTSPIGVYGRSKAAGEAAVRRGWARHLILRTSWLYSAHGTNFVRTMLRLASEKDELRVVDDQFGSPTSAADLAAAVLMLAERLCAGGEAAWGTYHYCGQGVTSWFGFACRIIAGLAARRRADGCRVVPITSAGYPTAARRPPYSVLDCRRIESTFGVARPPWQQSLETVLDRLLGPLP